MKACQYGVILVGLGLTQSRGKHMNMAAAFMLARDLYAYTKFAVMPMRGHGNVTGIDSVLAWQTGYPFGVNFSRGYPRFNPGEFTAVDMLVRREADAALVVAADPVATFPRRAQAHLARNDAARGTAMLDQLLREHGASADPDIADEVAKARWAKAFHHGQKREFASALAQLDSLIENYRGRNRHDYSRHASPLEWAEFQRTLCLKAMNRSGEALNALTSLMQKYPDSFLAIRAQRYVQQLQGTDTQALLRAAAAQRAKYVQAYRERGCGAVAAACLGRLLGREVDAGGQAAARPVSLDAEAPSGATMSMAAFADLLGSHGLHAVGMETDLAGLRRLTPPVLLLMRSSPTNHYVILAQLTDHWACLLDPAMGERVVHATDLQQAWTGNLLALCSGSGTGVGAGQHGRLLAQAEMAELQAGCWAEHWSASQTYHKPQQMPGGPSEIRGFSQVDPSARPGLYVSLPTGTPLMRHQGFRIPTRALPLHWIQAYPLTPISDMEGYNCNTDWSSNYEVGAWREPYSGIIWRMGGLYGDAGGWTLCFLPNVDGTYTSPPGVHEELTPLRSPEGAIIGYRIRHKEGTAEELRHPDPRFLQVNSMFWITSRSSRAGEVETVAYEPGTPKLRSVTACDGRELTFTYAYDGWKNWWIGSVADPLGRQVTYEAVPYEFHGVPITMYTTTQSARRVTTPAGAQEVVFSLGDLFGAASNPATFAPRKLVAGEGATWYLAPASMDFAWLRVASITDALGNPTHYLGNYATEDPLQWRLVIDSLKRQTLYLFTQGNLIAKVLPDGSVESFEVDADKNLIRIVDAAGNETRNSWDGWGNVTAVTKVLSGGIVTQHNIAGDPISGDNATELTATTYYTYEPTYNQISSQIDPLGRVTSYLYDSRGNRIKVIDALGNENSQAFDSYGQLLETKDAKGNVTKYEYDRYGNQTAVIDPLGNRTEHKYDLVGRRIETKDPKGNVTRFEYDELDRQTKSTNPDGTTDTFEYDTANNLLKKTDGRGKVTRFTYTLLQQLASVMQPDGSETNYEYDAVGRKTKMIDALNRETAYEYDIRDRLTKITYPDSKYEEFSYDPTGNLVSRKDRAGNTTTMTYDAFKRLLKVEGPP
jgi:YD repeat-containing protein